ncbi:MAG: hypothetical protein J6X03_00640 [Bacilli bacterium]|nr:hypothetical protein [Bacilli bacterium]
MKIFKIIALLLGVAVIAAPFVLVYGFIADDTTVEVERDDFTDFADFTMDTAYYAVENTQSTGKVNLEITQEKLNGLLGYIQDNFVPEQAKEYIKQAYVLIEDNNYDFYIEVTTPFFNTRVSLLTTLDYIPVDEQDAFYFKINKFGVGKLVGDGTFSTSIAGMFIKSEDINNALASAGFSINVDLNNLSLTYKIQDLYNDVKAKMQMEESSIFMDIADLLMTEQLVGFDFDSSIKINLNADRLHENTSYSYLPYEKDLHLTTHSDQIETLRAQNIITDEQTNDVFLYLVNGYDIVSDSIKNLVDGKDFSSIGITDVQAYDGEGLSQESALDTLILDQIDIGNIISTGHLANVYEQDLTTKLRANGLLGMGYLINVDENNQKKTNYLALSDLYLNIYNNKLVFTVNLSINGYKTQLCIDTTSTGPQGYSLPLTVDHIYFGNVTPSEPITDYLFGFLEGVSENFEWFSCNASTRTMSLEFEPIIDESSNATLIKSIVESTGGSLNLSLHGTDLADEHGYLSIGVTIA